MATIMLTLRVDSRLLAAVERKAGENRSAAIRTALAAYAGVPESYAAVQPEGRPRQKKPRRKRSADTV